ncbi:MAG: cupin domain-containing protein [Nitrospiraceae bacterium]
MALATGTKKEQSQTSMMELGGQVGPMVRQLRKAAHLSVRTLASKTAFSPSFISQVENGQASPSIASLNRIASALGVGLGEFFQSMASHSAAIVKAAERQVVLSGWSRGTLEALGTLGRHEKVEMFFITLAPGGKSGKQSHASTADQLAIVFEGEVLLTLKETEHRLRRGDSAQIPANTPHRWQNQKAKATRIILILGQPYL